MIGSIISHYKILDKIGEGGAGIVYKAEDISLNRTVALKFLPKGTVESIERKKLFIREAQAAASLDHPSICTIHGIEEVGDQLFIVMAYIEGDTLQKVIERQAFKIEEVVNIGLQIGEGLKEAHSKGLVHGDLKSTNIMITPKGTVKIMDFGLARPIGESTSTKPSTSHDSILYMSPEQVKKEKIDKRSDVWSFGIILYQMLTRNLPFKGSKEQAVLYSILSYNPTPIEKYRGNVPTEIADIIQKTLNKDPEVRYPDAGALLKELKHIEGKTFDEAGALPFTAGTGVQVLKKKKNLLLFTSVGVILLVLLLFLIFSKKDEGLKPGEKLKLAVMPFENINKRKDIDYICYGMTDEITNKLSRLRHLNVITHSSVAIRLYNFKEKSINKIGERLNVDYLVKGSVYQSVNNIFVTASLFNTENGKELWTNKYNRKNKDIFTIQRELTQQIAVTLKSNIPMDELDFIKKQPTTNFDAYNQYILGRYNWEKRTEEGATKAINHYKQAIVLDPMFAIAYAGIADSYIILGSYEFIDSKEAHTKAKDAAMKAIQLDEKLAEAYASLGGIKYSFEQDNEGAIKEFQKAIALNPGYATAYLWYANALKEMKGDTKQLLTEVTKVLEKALELDPFSTLILVNLATTNMQLHKWNDAEKLLRLSQELNDKSPISTPIFIELLTIIGKKDEAEKELDYLRKKIKDEPSRLDFNIPIAIPLTYLHRYNESIKILREAIRNKTGTFFAHYWLGFNLILDKKYQDAVVELKNALRIINRDDSTDLLLAVAYSRLGNISYLLNLEKNWISPDRKDNIYPFLFAIMYKELGQIDKMFYYLDKAIKEFDFNVIDLSQHPFFLEYHSDNRFKNILKKMNLI